MNIAKATRAFKVSRRAVQQVVREDHNSVKTFKKQPLKFTNDMKTNILIQL